MSRPKRIQRKRAKGWRLPEGAVCVTRPGIFGNPFASAIDFREWLEGHARFNGAGYGLRRATLLARLPELRGHDLACFCELPKPGEPDLCHGAVLLDILYGDNPCPPTP